MPTYNNYDELFAGLIANLPTAIWSHNIPEPAVLIMFDDGNSSLYDIAYPILVAAGIKATDYVASDLLDDAGYITTAQAQVLYAAGHDIGNHSKTHTNFTTLTQAQIETELSACEGVLNAAGLTRASKHVAYPFGAGGVDADTLAAMAATGMLTGRAALFQAGDVTFQDVHTTGLYNLPVRRYIRPILTIEATKAALLDAKTNNKMIICLFHTIDELGVADYSCSAANFTEILNYIQSIGLRSLTISEWYAEYKGLFPTTSAMLATVGSAVDAIKLKTDLMDASAITVVAAVNGSTITILRGDTFDDAHLLNLGDLTDYVSLDFIVKRSRGESDDDAIIHIRKNASGLNDGLLRLNGAAHTTGTDGSITIDDISAGDITPVLKATVTDDLIPDNCIYDVQKITAASVKTRTAGKLIITSDVTMLVV